MLKNAAMGALACLSALAAAPPAVAQATGCGQGTHQTAQTPRLGLQFIQAGAPALLCLADAADPSTTAVIATVQLKRAPLEIHAPKSNWPEAANDPAMSVAVSDQPGFAKLLKFGSADEDTPYFGPYRAMADDPFGAGRLMTAESALPATTRTDYGYNYLDKDRFSASGAEYFGVLISRIDRRYGNDDLMKADAPVTLVFYIDKHYGHPPRMRDKWGEHDIVDVNEVDVVEAHFAD